MGHGFFREGRACACCVLRWWGGGAAARQLREAAAERVDQCEHPLVSDQVARAVSAEHERLEPRRRAPGEGGGERRGRRVGQLVAVELELR